MYKAAFFDRDGTINVDTGYLCNLDELVFLPRIPELIRFYNSINYIAIVVTNQSGIGRGKFSVQEMEHFHFVMNERLKKEYNAHIDAFYYCPHLPESSCNCRKPKPGMFLRAIEDYNINPTISISYGDSLRDKEASDAAGIGTFHYVKIQS